MPLLEPGWREAERACNGERELTQEPGMHTTQGTTATQNILFQEPALSLGGYAVLVKEELGTLSLAFLSNHNGSYVHYRASRERQ